jgi:hypothetical protein
VKAIRERDEKRLLGRKGYILYALKKRTYGFVLFYLKGKEIDGIHYKLITSFYGYSTPYGPSALFIVAVCTLFFL